jgi:chromosome segregation ATPase
MSEVADRRDLARRLYERRAYKMAMEELNAVIASLESQNQALQEDKDELYAEREEDARRIAALQERAERAEHLLRAIAFDDQGKLQAWLQPLYIREPYVTVLVDKATQLLSPTQGTDPE